MKSYIIDSYVLTNKTFLFLLEICNNLNIQLFSQHNQLKNINELLIECNKKKKIICNLHIDKINNIIVNKINYLDSQQIIDKSSNELKNKLKYLDLLEELLTKVYNDESLENMFKKKYLDKGDINFIEEFSN